MHVHIVQHIASYAYGAIRVMMTAWRRQHTHARTPPVRPKRCVAISTAESSPPISRSGRTGEPRRGLSPSPDRALAPLAIEAALIADDRRRWWSDGRCASDRGVSQASLPLRSCCGGRPCPAAVSTSVARPCADVVGVVGSGSEEAAIPPALEAVADGWRGPRVLDANDASPTNPDSLGTRDKARTPWFHVARVRTCRPRPRLTTAAHARARAPAEGRRETKVAKLVGVPGLQLRQLTLLALSHARAHTNVRMACADVEAAHTAKGTHQELRFQPLRHTHAVRFGPAARRRRSTTTVASRAGLHRTCTYIRHRLRRGWLRCCNRRGSDGRHLRRGSDGEV